MSAHITWNESFQVIWILLAFHKTTHIIVFWELISLNMAYFKQNYRVVCDMSAHHHIDMSISWHECSFITVIWVSRDMSVHSSMWYEYLVIWVLIHHCYMSIKWYECSFITVIWVSCDMSAHSLLWYDYFMIWVLIHKWSECLQL